MATLLNDGSVTAERAVDQFFMATYEETMRAVYRHFPNLAEFDGQSHEGIVAKFQKLDRKRIELARQEVAMCHYRSLPRGETDIGEMAVVRHEVQKKSRHLPIRKLIAKAGRAIQAIKPVFMMSPLSIAQFLQPGAVEFDLLLIDEASQVRPVDALGAIGRCKKFVVVGDDKQLPPTTFFEKLTGNVETTEEEDDAQAGDLESVLGLCLARNVTQRMLRWHYRSRHHTLIAVSNHEFYNDRLHIVPSPDREPVEMGLRFKHVANGVFDRGKSATNRTEARAVALAMIEHARKHPDLSLGVGTFSVAQRDAVRDELELLLRENPDVDRYFSTGDGEPYFIKNLESLQGDERDVIFISIGYARDESGFFAMSFGPLATPGGERRLNVLISRARMRCEVFSSITAEDIDLNRARSRGAAALKTFLKYAQSGILDAGTPTDREADSDFELEVKRCLVQHGYEVDTQVGVAGFFPSKRTSGHGLPEQGHGRASAVGLHRRCGSVRFLVGRHWLHLVLARIDLEGRRSCSLTRGEHPPAGTLRKVVISGNCRFDAGRHCLWPGDDLVKAKIFVQIPAYRDRELSKTLLALFRMANAPSHLRVVVAWQYGDGETLDPRVHRLRNLEVIPIPAAQSRGPNWARQILQSQYRGEAFTLLLDSHRGHERPAEGDSRLEPGSEGD